MKYWKKNGFYLVLDESEEAFGLAMSLYYLEEFRQIQLMLQIGYEAIAIGYEFKGR